MLKGFKEFVLRGNVIDLAIAVILGTAFGAIVKSLVNDIIMPPIGLVMGGVDFSNLFLLLKAGSPTPPYASLADAQAAGAVTISYGVFVNAIVSFLVVAFVTFLLVRSINRMTPRKESAPPEATTKECSYCLSTVPIKATRCASCTSDLPAS